MSGFSCAALLRARRDERARARASAAADARARHDARAAQDAQDAARGVSTAAGTLPFREVVELFAKAHNLSFMPNVRRGRVEGKQVYILGDHNVYMEDGVTWRELRRAPGAGAGPRRCGRMGACVAGGAAAQLTAGRYYLCSLPSTAIPLYIWFIRLEFNTTGRTTGSNAHGIVGAPTRQPSGAEHSHGAMYIMAAAPGACKSDT